MTRHNVFFAMALLIWMSPLTTPAVAQQPVTPPAAIQVNSPIVTMNNSAGNQTDPHVNGDIAAYTDSADQSIHYYRFSTATDTAIPHGSAEVDTLSDVSGNRICLTRQTAGGDFEIVIFDVTTLALTEIDPHPGDVRMGCALGGNTLVYIDFGTGTGSGDVFVYDLGANPPTPPQPLSLSANDEQNPNVSSDGNTVVWESCPTPSNCDVVKAVRSSGVWTVSTVVNSSSMEENPDSDGSWITYDSNQPSATAPDIFFQLVAGGQESYLAINGPQVNPSISKGVIGFESTLPPATHPDIFVYDIANNELYQVTSTANVDEELNDVSVLDNGDVRVVWAANDGDVPAGSFNTYATTFTPLSHQITYQICPLYDPNIAKKSGAAYPIKLQLCDSAGNNISSPSIVVHAVSVTKTSSNTPIELDDTGNANPDFDFRYDSSLIGYVFNLSTKGYATGTYKLNFTAGADPNTHSTGFAVK
jgi:hypothetical protein